MAMRPQCGNYTKKSESSNSIKESKLRIDFKKYLFRKIEFLFFPNCAQSTTKALIFTSLSKIHG